MTSDDIAGYVDEVLAWGLERDRGRDAARLARRRRVTNIAGAVEVVAFLALLATGHYVVFAAWFVIVVGMFAVRRLRAR